MYDVIDIELQKSDLELLSCLYFDPNCTHIPFEVSFSWKISVYMIFFYLNTLTLCWQNITSDFYCGNGGRGVQKMKRKLQIGNKKKVSKTRL